jgi:predicted permease
MSLIDDARLGLRLLVRDPAFSVVAILTLALGIGANTALYSVVDGVLLRPAPVPEIGRVAMLWETDRNSGTTREPASVPDFLDYAARSRSFEGLAAFAAGDVGLVPPQGDPVRLAGLQVTGRFFPLLGIEPLLGRVFTPAEDEPGTAPVALISESLWERLAHRDPAILGTVLPLDDAGRPIVVGVVPDRARFGIRQILAASAYAAGTADGGAGGDVDVWTPLQADPQRLPRETHPILLFGRLAPGVPMRQAGDEAAAIAADLERQYPVNAGRGAFVEPLGDVIFRPVRPALLMLLGAVGMVLATACVNVANLLLARGTARAREMAVRAALGAERGRLARQFLVENLILTGIAAAAGVLLAAFGTEMLIALAPADIPRIREISLNPRVLAVTTGVALLSALFFSMVPMLQVRFLDLLSALRTAGTQSAGGGRGERLRSAMVVAQTALGVVLVIGAGLLVKSFWRLSLVDPGFRAQGVLKADLTLPPSRYPASPRTWPDFREMHTFNDALLNRVTALPGVASAALVGEHPLDPGFTNSFVVVGREAEARAWPEISVRRVSPGYFPTVGLPLVRGRLFDDRDGTRSRPAALLNEAAARRFFAQREPIGERIRMWGAERTVVGIVADERTHGLGAPAPISLYLPLAQAPSFGGQEVLLARTAADPADLAPAVRRSVREIDPSLALAGVEPLETTVERSLRQRRFTLLLLSTFAAVAMSLAAVGLYGVLSYAVARRTREIGIRMALGASPRMVRRLVLRRGLTLGLLGLVAGVPAAFAFSLLLRNLLFGVAPSDPGIYLSVSGLLLAVALVAAGLPARRATRIDPNTALHSE